MLFKIDRCELEIGKAAQRAYQLLEHFEGDVKVANKIEPRGANVGGARGLGSARKSVRGIVRKTVGGSSVGDSSSGVCPVKVKLETEAVTKHGDELERALRLLTSGATALAARRRDASAEEKSQRPGNSQGKKRKLRQGKRQTVSDDNHDDDDCSEEAGTAHCRVRARNRFRGALGKKTRSRGSRIRSRNAVIDKWLAEEAGGEGDRTDAFVDLEDFLDG